MAANVIVTALIVGYVIFLLYRRHKRKKFGLSGGCGYRCSSCAGDCGGSCKTKTETSLEKEEKKMQR